MSGTTRRGLLVESVRFIILCLVAARGLSWCGSGSPKHSRESNHVRRAAESAAVDGDRAYPFSSVPPYLALITEPDACDTDDSVRRTLKVLTEAVSTGGVDLVSIRQAVPVNGDRKDETSKRLVQLAEQLMALSLEFSFRLVISSDWTKVTDSIKVNGIHVKESHRHRIPEMRQNLGKDVLIGTSAHTIESATDAWRTYRPDYLFVGTCYITQTHPEKTACDLEGPELPGLVVKALDAITRDRPRVLAIGGIDADNCYEPVKVYGADGVATIRAVLQSAEPAQIVREMKDSMS
jgi:thiamine-phosphate pyrophosphorylase